MGRAGLQLRTKRSPELSDFERALLARQVPHRRPPRGRRRFHALPRLLPQARRVGPQSVRRPRESPSDRLHQAYERSCTWQIPWHSHYRGTVNFVACCPTPPLSRRTRPEFHIERVLDELYHTLLL